MIITSDLKFILYQRLKLFPVVISIVLVIINLLACKNKDEEMSKIIADLAIIQEIIRQTPEEVKDSLSNMYMNKIYDKYNTDQQSLKGLLEKYQDDPSKMEQIYRKAIENLDSLNM